MAAAANIGSITPRIHRLRIFGRSALRSAPEIHNCTIIGPMLTKLGRAGRQRETAAKLYRAIVTRSREPAFYRQWGVADTIDGRFDVLALHSFLVFDALRDQGAGASELGSELADAIFTGFDEALRELGVSDFGMGRRMRKLANAFYGRMQSYGAGQVDHRLMAALQRNLYRGDARKAAEAAGLASYICMARAHLRRDVSALLEGRPDFGPLPKLVKTNE
jgi:cytochrome b pre-mRNA-processing protein 3